MEEFSALNHHFLIAMPSIEDPFFKHTVIYICEHRQYGTMGLIVNRPLEQSISLLFEQLTLVPERELLIVPPLLLGGPLQIEHGFVIHRPPGLWRSSLYLADDVTITTSKDIIEALAAGLGPADLLVAMGYVAWNRAQLEKEMLENRWLVCPYRAELLYTIPFAERWDYAASSIGFTFNQLIEGTGHA